MNAGKPTLFKTRLEVNPGLTITGMYNVLEKLRREEPQGKMRWLRPEHQAPEETPEPPTGNAASPKNAPKLQSLKVEKTRSS